MKAKLLIKEVSRGFYLEVDNGYGNKIMLTDILHTMEDVQVELKRFKEIVDNPVIERL